MMTLLEKALRYRRVHGTRKLIRDGVARVWAQCAGMAAPGVPMPATEDSGWVGARELVTARNQATSAIRLYTAPDSGTRRVSLVTDSINRWSLSGGVGTAMILAALVAEERQARLRIVTRTERAKPDGLEGVFSLYGIGLSREVELAHAPCYDNGYEIDTFADELYITTSWWTTASALQSVQPESIVYLLQEDEWMFYPYGYEHLRCSEILRNRDIRFLVNTKLLFDHLVHEGFANIASRGPRGEPSPEYPRDRLTGIVRRHRPRDRSSARG